MKDKLVIILAVIFVLSCFWARRNSVSGQKEEQAANGTGYSTVDGSAEKETRSHGLRGAGLILVFGGIVSTFRPKLIWSISAGRKHKDEAPTDEALGVYRGAGIGAIIFGIVFLAV